MLTPIAYGLAIALNLMIIWIGVRFVLQPMTAAAGYGVAAKENGATSSWSRARASM